MASVVSIQDAVTTDGATYYHIHVKLPLRAIRVVRRYSEFSDLVASLSSFLGIDPKDFPYSLPPKSAFFNKNSERTISERKEGLAAFLQQIINDSELNNTTLVHDFLQLPSKFKFTPNLLRNSRGTSTDISNLIISNVSDVDGAKWLELIRLFRANVNELMEKFNNSNDVSVRMDIHSKLQAIVRPNLEKMEAALDAHTDRNLIDKPESDRRRLVYRELLQEVDALGAAVQRSHEQRAGPASRSEKSSRRIFGAVETKETLPLNNRELLQQQVQIHKQQDNELLELRKIIHRQKEIGLTINQEVEEQNALLDALNDQVEDTTGKLRTARKKARDIL